MLCGSRRDSCVVGDMMAVMPSKTRTVVRDLDPGMSSSTLSREQAVRSAHKLVQNTQVAAESFCSKHRRDCRCFRRRRKRRITLEVAGSTCVAFSARGSGQRLAHFPSAVVFFIWNRHILSTLSDHRARVQPIFSDRVVDVLAEAVLLPLLQCRSLPDDDWLSDA